jgi:TetR/AcrR family transcriptional regulator, tetracycline repressor protein
MSASDGEAAAPPKRRGRKPRASREEIVDAAIELLERDPHEPLTIARVADAVGLAPMTLYRYFDDRAELLGAIVRAVRVGRPPISVDAELAWQDQVSAWMTSVRDQIVRYPQLLQFTVEGGHQAWLVDGAELVAILERLGDWDDDTLARAHYWVAATTLGHAIIEANRPAEARTSAMYGELAHLPEDAAARMARVIPGLVRLHDEAFDLVVERTVASLELMLPTPPA